MLKFYRSSTWSAEFLFHPVDESPAVKSETNLAELDKLVNLFYENNRELGEFRALPAAEIPEPQRSLLNHEMHMTVTVEKFHSSAVDVGVFREQRGAHSYCREICLKRQSDQRTVQYGIVRLNFRHLEPAVQQEIEQQGKPLGRILIEHDVLRRVKLLSLYSIEPSDHLAALVNSDASSLFGRTAIIYCNEEPAIELLEIVID